MNEIECYLISLVIAILGGNLKGIDHHLNLCVYRCETWQNLLPESYITFLLLQVTNAASQQ